MLLPYLLPSCDLQSLLKHMNCLTRPSNPERHCCIFSTYCEAGRSPLTRSQQGRKQMQFFFFFFKRRKTELLMNTWNCSRIFELQRNVNGLGLSLLASLFRGWGGLFPSQSVCWSFLGGWERTPCSTHASSLTGEVNLRRFWHVNMHTWSRIPPYHSCLRTLDHGGKPVCKSYAKHHIPFFVSFLYFLFLLWVK